MSRDTSALRTRRPEGPAVPGPATPGPPFPILLNVTLLVVAGAYGLVLAFAMQLGLFGLIIIVFVALSVWRYGYDVLRKVAQGHHEIPAPDIGTMSPVSQWMSVWHCLFFASATVLLVPTPTEAFSFVELARWASAAALLGTLPASAALMAMTASLAVALNPVDIASVIRTLGARYTTLVLTCWALPLSWFLLWALPLPQLLTSVLQPVTAVWVLLATFALVGAALRERRDMFAIPGEHIPEDERDLEHERCARQQIMDRAYASIRSGLAAQGYREIKQLLAAERHSTETYEWVFQALLSWEDKSHALALARGFVNRLIDDDHPQAALDLYRQCRRLARDFCVDGRARDALAAHARDIGQEGLADELIMGDAGHIGRR